MNEIIFFNIYNATSTGFFFYLLNLIKIMELNYIGDNFIEIALFKLNNTSMDQMEDIYTKYNKWIY